MKTDSITICFEGPSAVGKSTVAQLLSDSFLVVPEVNLMYQRPPTPSHFWYFERQLDRYALCTQNPQNSILDGDVFQPVWYNWIYGYPPSNPSLEETTSFYRDALKNNQIAYPDIYVVFEAEVDQLVSRKEHDDSRQRRNFEKHLDMIEPQHKYFSFLQNNTDIRVVFCRNDEPNSTAKEIRAAIQSLEIPSIDQEATFDKIISWLP